MSSVTVRNLPDEVHRALRIHAARHGRSTEAEHFNQIRDKTPAEPVRLE